MGGEGEEPVLLREKCRLEQNRQAARRFRARRKAYVQQLEDELKNLRELCEKDDLRQCVMSVGTSPVMRALISAHEKHKAVVKSLEEMVTKGTRDEEVRPLVEEGMKVLLEHSRIRKEALMGDGAHCVLDGESLSPLERPFHWLGGFQPSRMLSALRRRLKSMAYNEALLYDIQTYIGVLCEREISLDTVYQQLKDAVVLGSENEDELIASPMQAKQLTLQLTGLRALVNQAEDLRMDALQRYWGIVDWRARAVIVCAPLMVLNHLDTLLASFGPVVP